jgi:hypothetical protein
MTKNENAMRNFAIPGPRVDEYLYNRILDESRNEGQAQVIRNAILLFMHFLPDDLKDVLPEPTNQGERVFKLQNTYLFPDDFKMAQECAAQLGGMSSFVRRALYLFIDFNGDVEEKS